MKYLGVIILSLILVICVNVEVVGLSLDLNNDILEFAIDNKLSEEEIENLRDPFSRSRAKDELEDMEVNDEFRVEVFEDEMPVEPEVTASSESAPELEEEIIREPEFRIDGYVKSSDSRVVLIIENKLLRTGESYNEYEFKDFTDRNAVFVRDGMEFKLQVGGGF